MDGKKKSIDVEIEALMLHLTTRLTLRERPRSPYPFDSQSDASAAAAAAAAADPHCCRLRSQTAGQGSDYDNAPPPPYEPVDPLALATEHGLELNAPSLGFLRWCGSYRNEAIAGVDCEMTPFDSRGQDEPRMQPDGLSISFVQLNRVRLDPRFLSGSGHKTCEIVDGDCKPVAHEHWGNSLGPREAFRHQFVRADHVIKLREQLDKLGKVPGMLGEEKATRPVTCCSCFVDSSQYDLKLPDTETLLHLTLLQAGLKLTQTPHPLGKDYKLFDRVVPSTELDISNLLTEHPRQCCVCGKLAELECHDCFLQFQEASKDYTFCKKCFDNNKDHKNQRRSTRPLELNILTGLESGYNIPEVTDAGDIDSWLNGSKLKDSSVRAA
uniref:ZZ-type domain-containing protein n=1 Tax=Macrostomum lignano TaxID=282301 RepID=A0A1I8FBM8_9PLAT